MLYRVGKQGTISLYRRTSTLQDTRESVLRVLYTTPHIFKVIEDKTAI